jgi:hypothetical protein
VMRSTWPSIRKEVRALAPVWLAGAAAMLALRLTGGRVFRGFELPAYVLGVAALGALSVGHEYTHRTISLLLSQPVRRERVLFLKLGVLAPMLLALSAVASLVLPFRPGVDLGGPGAPAEYGRAILWLPLFYGLFVAPWFTLLSRSAMAGTVFTLAMPGLLLVLGEQLGIARYGYTRDVDTFQLAFLWQTSMALCSVGGVMSWRMFMRLEAIEGQGPEVRLPEWLRGRGVTHAASGLTRRHPIWLLVKKELRLQQMALAVAALYLAGYVVLTALKRPNSEFSGVVFALSAFYGGLLSMLIGSLASAEERQLGTHDWQLLLPVATSKQWAIKVGVVLGLAVMLGFCLPVALLEVLPPGALPLRSPISRFIPPLTGIVLLTAGSLYVSTLCRSGVWALLMSLPAAFGVVLFIQFIASPLGSAAFWAVSGVSQRGARRAVYAYPSGGFTLFLLTGFCALLVGFAFVNHRSAESAPWRAWKPVLWLAIAIAGGFAVVGARAAFR